MVIIFISFAILALVIGSNMTAITVDEKRKNIEGMSKNVSEMITEMYSPASAESFKQTFEAEEDEFFEYVKYASKITGELKVFLFDSEGRLIKAVYAEDAEIFASNTFSAATLSKLKANGELGGYDTVEGSLKTSVLYSAKPVFIKGQSGNNEAVVGYVFTCATESVVKQVIGTTVKTLVLASLWIFLAALVAVYFLSERISSPLKHMSRAAKSYATGNFDIRIPVQGSDEVAELATAFNQMATGLQNLENMRRSFLANVSHDLKTPMTTISGFIDAILSGAIPPEDQHEYLERIKNEVLRLSRLVRQLLDLSRLQAGDRKITPETFDICELARLIVLSFEQKIEDKQLDVEFECECENISVYADKDAIHQVMYNLCDNAVKFAREKGKYKISIFTEDKKAHVSVYNEGQGIEKEDLPFVFERFYKSDKSRGLDKTGVGLGLYISKTIIDAHRETITVDSEQGSFCEFEFTLPLIDSKKPLIEKTAQKD